MIFNIDELVRDLRDRFTTWETVLGGLFIVAGVFIYLNPQYLVNFAVPGVLVFIGFKWLFTNKYKSRAKDDLKARDYRGLYHTSDSRPSFRSALWTM